MGTNPIFFKGEVMELLTVAVMELFIIAVCMLIILHIYKVVKELRYQIKELRYQIARMDQDISFFHIQIENLTNRKS